MSAISSLHQPKSSVCGLKEASIHIKKVSIDICPHPAHQYCRDSKSGIEEGVRHID